MIGVVVSAGDEAVVREFFELFKTPWEFVRPVRRYDVLLCGPVADPELTAPLVLCFAAGTHSGAADSSAVPRTRSVRGQIKSPAGDIPIYGDCSTFSGEPFAGLTEVSRGEAAAVGSRSPDSTVVRLGYDLFAEVRHLLTSGQPAASALVPTLELHIALLRHLITSAGLPLVEIPPVPAGHAFMACLTHDVDHPVQRHHWLDHTMVGFLYRATIGSLLGVARGRFNLRQLFQNWGAAAAIPLVHSGHLPDPWRRSLTGYLQLERGLKATFFVIPFRGRPGRSADGIPAPRRAAAYEPAEILGELRELLAGGQELGVHGIDAWCDHASGCAERQKIAEVSGARELGVRMHWLWFGPQSPAILEQAGYSYDSTVGYNETVGFRAGTTQAYRPLNATGLLELPLHVMDTALFYPSHLDLAPAAAQRLVRLILDHAVRFGGALTINWHDRSIAPERLWDGFYLWLLQELKTRGAWFPTCSEAVTWFRRRRSVVFESESRQAGTLRIRTSGIDAAAIPALRLRIHRPQGQAAAQETFMDLPCQNGELAIAV